MKKYTQKEVVKTEKVLEGISCDICGTVVEEGKLYFEVTTGHGRWGNDSVDSIEHFDLCHYICLVEHQRRYFLRELAETARYDIEVEER